jgi:hypothetical protein
MRAETVERAGWRAPSELLARAAATYAGGALETSLPPSCWHARRESPISRECSNPLAPVRSA